MQQNKSFSSLSRRDFVLGSAALAGSASLFAMSPSADPVVNWAAPRGMQRNLLAKACSPEKLKSSLIPREKYRPFPTIHDRRAWEALRAETRISFLTEGEKYLKYEWPAMPATVFLEYARMGNRSHYQTIRYARMGALQALMLAECVENKGRFLDDITNGIWATCEESFWGVPAHLYIQKADLGLPDPRDPIVDLFAAQTSALLATAVYLLDSSLDTVSPLIRDRVFFESERRIFEPLLAQNFMWMGLPGGKPRHDLPWIDVPDGQVQPVNNWDAWICWNWLTTVLFLDQDADRRYKGVQKIMVCLDKFINTYPADGGCEEGPGYWSGAAGDMFDGLELLHSATNGAVNLYEDPLITQMGLYMNRVHIAGNYYINPGDAGPIVHLDVDRIYRFGKRVQNADLITLALSGRSEKYRPHTLPAIFNEAELRAQPPAEARLLRDTWLSDTHVMAARRKADSSDGLYLACIASDNGKSHSHNDTGSVWVYSQGLPVLIDLGQESYSKKSFDSHRYEIPSTQSAFHNLPTIGGVQQGVGPMFRATDLVYESNDRSAQLGMELANAYPVEAKLKSWKRTVKLDRVSNVIEINDKYFLSGQVSDITLSLMTCCTVTQSGKGELTLLSPQGAPPTVITFDPVLLTAKIETIPLDNSELVANWGKEAYRILLKTSGANTSGLLKVTVAAR
jgi:hypothetical protein